MKYIYGTLVIIALAFTLKSESQEFKGYFIRMDDYSVYKYEENQFILKKVGFHLKRGLFNEGEAKVKDIYTEEGEYYGFDIIKNQHGEEVRRRKVNIKNFGNSIKIISLRSQNSQYLKKISETDFLQYKYNASNMLKGLWKRKSDNSVYNFNTKEAILDRCGSNLGKIFSPGEIKLSDLRKVDNGIFLAKDKFKSKSSGRIWTETAILFMNYNGNIEVRYKKDNYELAYVLEPVSL